jgi:hypothetical protein
VRTRRKAHECNHGANIKGKFKTVLQARRRKCRHWWRQSLSRSPQLAILGRHAYLRAMPRALMTHSEERHAIGERGTLLKTSHSSTWFPSPPNLHVCDGLGSHGDLKRWSKGASKVRASRQPHRSRHAWHIPAQDDDMRGIVELQEAGKWAS